VPPINDVKVELPLTGISVLDVGQFIAAPVCAALLADLGADVIRLERPQGTADRFVTPLSKDMPDIGALYSFANRGKRSLALDLRAPDSRDIVERLVSRTDVVTANMPQAALEKLRLDLPSLRAVNPQILLSNTTAYGNEGPWKSRTGFDGMAQAMSGAMHMSGDRDEPRKSYVHFVDFYAGALSAVGILGGLMQRSKGKGSGLIETSLLASAMMMMNSTLAEQALLQPNRVGMGNRAQTGGPADIFRTRDGWIILQVMGNPKFATLCKLMGKDELISDPRFGSDNLRGDNAAALNDYVQEWCASMTSEACVDALSGVKLCASPVLSPADALEHPQVAGHSSRHDVHYEEANIDVPLFMPFTGSTAQRAPTPAPRLGQHSRPILAEVGYSDADIDGFIASGLISSIE
jgi:crotonobetainyl-CoA:carnitine CoA-transferase CaiB-like acyl-CoA transferase